MTAIGLLKGNLTADDYEDATAADPRIDQLRDLMQVEEDESYSRDYHAPEKRSIANAVQVYFKDGASTEKVEVEYPIGHRRRREEGIPLLVAKFERNLATRFPPGQAQRILDLCADGDELAATPVHEFMDLLVI